MQKQKQKMPKSKQKYRNAHHIPVLLEEVITVLSPAKGQSYLDLTAGMGGHAAAVIAATNVPKKATLVDRDPQAVDILKKRFGESKVLGQDFLSASQKLVATGRRFDMILADLGVSSLHFDEASRGFSFLRSGPLDMRMDPRQPLTAEQIVKNWTVGNLTKLLAEAGEEPRAETIAKAIVAARPLVTTDQLAAVVSGAIPKRAHGRIHPATKTFQALRIAVNDELNQLAKSLLLWLELLADGGRLAIISFHSLEDRLVKIFLAEHSKHLYQAELKLLTKKPISASPNQVAINPRARSAKLRAAVKIKIERT